MPFSKVSTVITCFRKNFGKGGFVKFQTSLVRKRNTDAEGVTPSQATGAGRRTDGGSRVEPVESKTIGSHGVDRGRVNPSLIGMRTPIRVGDSTTVAGGVSPTHIVRHGEDDVGSWRRRTKDRECDGHQGGNGCQAGESRCGFRHWCGNGRMRRPHLVGRWGLGCQVLESRRDDDFLQTVEPLG